MEVPEDIDHPVRETVQLAYAEVSGVVQRAPNSSPALCAQVECQIMLSQGYPPSEGLFTAGEALGVVSRTLAGEEDTGRFVCRIDKLEGVKNIFTHRQAPVFLP